MSRLFHTPARGPVHGPGFPILGKKGRVFSNAWNLLTWPAWALALGLAAAGAQAATPVPMAAQSGLVYAETFNDIANWADDFSSGSGAAAFGVVAAGGAASIPDPTRMTYATTNWTSGTTGGKQKGPGALVLLATGSSDNTTALAVDLFLDFTGVRAGTLGFDWASVNNSTGDRCSSLRVYWSTNGVAFAELAAAQVLNVQNNNPSTGAVRGVSLPAELNGAAGARLRFYGHNGAGGTTGSRPKISLDNLRVTATNDGSAPLLTLTNPADAEVLVPYTSTVCTLAGVCSTSVVGHLRWTNRYNGAGGQVAAATNWAISGVTLADGDNPITVTGTNRAGAAAVGQVLVHRWNRQYATIMAANLSGQISECETTYGAEAERIFKGLQPDIVAIQEWNVTNASRRAFVDAVFGTGFAFCVEAYGTCPMPNGIISRWAITASGEWNDPELSNRDFTWATINLPGTQDLHIVSLHIKAGDTSADEDTRELEARALTNYMRVAGWPAWDFVVVAGDFNAGNRSDAGVQVVTQLVSDLRQPSDQNGDKDTNIPRNKPYDYVLPNALLESNQVTLTVGGLDFPNGLVFDSRLWAAPPAPIRTNDSAGTGIQHLAVLKRFLVADCTDCDRDGMPEAWETAQFGDTLIATAESDWDGDGARDAAEYWAGTEATNWASALRVDSPAPGPAAGQYLIRWDSVAGKRYRVERGTNLFRAYSVLRTNLPAAPPHSCYTDAPPSGWPAVYYRVRLEP